MAMAVALVMAMAMAMAVAVDVRLSVTQVWQRSRECLVCSALPCAPLVGVLAAA